MEELENFESLSYKAVDWDSAQSNDRNKIMHISTQIESEIANLLRIAIGDYTSKSISFGYSSSALSLAARINLLIDFNVFSSDEKKYFAKFTEIRNKFAHNHHVNSLYEMLVSDSKREILNFLERHFKTEIVNYAVNADNSWILYRLLIGKIEIALKKLYVTLIKSAREKGIIDYRNSFYNTFDEVIFDVNFIKQLSGEPLDILIKFSKEINRRLEKKIRTTSEAAALMENKSLL